MESTVRSQLRHSTQPDFSLENAEENDSWGRTKPMVSPQYVAGLTDGEGCFYVHVRESSLYRAGALVQMHFHIKLQERDKSLLEKVRNTLGCGAVYFQHETRRNHTQCYRYTVNAARDILETIIPFFRRYPLQSVSKSKSFEIFCEIAEMYRAGEHLTVAGVQRIRELKATMNQRTIGLA